VITEKDHIRGWRQNKNKKDTIAQSVAPARLKQLIKTEFQATSGEYIEVTAKLVKATATCPECGKVQGKDTSQRVHDCNCGCKMDRDTAAAINLARYQLQKKQSYPIRSRGVLSWDANASGSTGGQLVVSTIIDTSVAKRSHTEKLDFNKFRE
jgi:transposase